MSCNGCRVLRKGCSETCMLRPCLQWIDGAEAQGNATLFVAKFFGRTGLTGFISSVPDSQRPVLFKSLLYEACGRTVNPIYGAVGLLWSGNWHICQDAVKMVFDGGNPHPVSQSAAPCSSPVAGDLANISLLNLHKFHTGEEEPILPKEHHTNATAQHSATYQLENEIYIERLGRVNYPAMHCDSLNMSVKSIKRSLGAILDTNLSLSCHEAFDNCKGGQTENLAKKFQQQNSRKRQHVQAPLDLTLPISLKPQLATQPPRCSTEDIAARRNPNISEAKARNMDLKLSLSLHPSSNAATQQPGINNKQPSLSSRSVNSEGSVTSLDTADLSIPLWPCGDAGSSKLLQLLCQRQGTQMNKQAATSLNYVTAP